VDKGKTFISYSSGTYKKAENASDHIEKG